MTNADSPGADPLTPITEASPSTPTQADDSLRDTSLGWHVAVLARKMSMELDAELRKNKLNISHWPTLIMLWEREGLSQRELAEGCMTEHYTTSRTLDRLVALGLVERRDDPNSRRTSRIYLTAKGRALQKPLWAVAERVNLRRMERLTLDARADLMQMLRVMNQV